LPAGWDYAEKLKEFVVQRRAKTFEQKGLDPKDHRLVIWTSARRRAHHTAWPFLASSQSHTSSLAVPAYAPGENDVDVPVTIVTSPLNVKVIEKAQMGEINPGVWDGLDPDQARKYYPDEWKRFAADPYAYRAPRAESYHDLCVRLEPILIELEREEEDLLIIGHASVIRCLLAYLIGLPGPQVPAIEIARGDLLEVVPTSYGVHCQTIHFWDGPGRRTDGTEHGKDESNFYENYAEDTRGKKTDEASE
jgi:6-phosphofructo-2-kinase/fructose-2,6-biphosphatase 4